MVSLTIYSLAMVNFAINILTILILATINICIVGLAMNYLFIG
jgi:hypothetical protein